MIKKDSQKLLSLLVFYLLPAIGGLLVFYAMNWGPWAYSDSSAYVSAARNFLSGNGFGLVHSSGNLSAVTEFPPFYPAFLSAFLGINSDFINSIRFVNIILFFFSISIFSRILFITSQDHILTLIGSLLFISFPLIISTFSSVMSEPLFILLLLLSLYVVQIYIQKQKRIYLVLFTFISSLLPITRYAGILFVGIFGVCLFFTLKLGSIFNKLKIIISYYFFAYLPIAIWGYSLLLQFRQFGGKDFIFDFSLFSGLINSFEKQFNVIKLWIPYIDVYQSAGIKKTILITTISSVAILFFFTILILINNKSLDHTKQKNLFVFSFSSLIGYIFFIGLIYSITIPQIDIIDRMMVPVYPLFILIIITSIKSLFLCMDQKVLNYSVLLIIGFFILRFNFLFSNSYIQNLHENGLGFTSRVYRQSGIIDAIKKRPPTQILLSNSAGLVLFYDNRYPIQINIFPDHVFGDGGSYGEKIFREENAALILFFSDFSNYYNDQAGNLINNVTKNLTIEYIDSEGGIYTYPIN
jgi:hypothetical protein